jgi:hypothetical protein
MKRDEPSKELADEAASVATILTFPNPPTIS